MELDGKQKKAFNPFVLIGVLTGVAVIILTIITVMRLSRTNPYGEQVIINNLGQEYKDFTEDQKDLVYNSLYYGVTLNVSDTGMIPKEGAMVRSGSASRRYNASDGTEQGSFIVDIASIQQSYEIDFTWVVDENSTYDNGYPVIVKCLDASEQIYNFVNCQDAFLDPLVEKYPIINDLPIIEQYYDKENAVYIYYTVIYKEKDDGFVLLITDYSGGNYDRALSEIRKRGYDPLKFEIEYKDLSSFNKWVYVGD